MSANLTWSILLPALLAGLVQRMTEMGLNVGGELAVRQRQGGGGLVVSHGETRYALGAGMAHRVKVERVVSG